MAMAVEYYHKSADHDYSGAHNRLGRMYMEGEFFDQDWDKAYEHLAKARSIEDTPENNIQLARFYCTAPGKHKNIDECIRLLDMDQYKAVSKQTADRAQDAASAALAWIIAEGKFTGNELGRIHETVKKTFNFNQLKASIKVDKEGEFAYEESDKFGMGGKYVLIDESFDIKAKDDDKGRFGIRFMPDVPGINGIEDRVLLAFRWVQTNSEGKRKVFNSRVIFGPAVLLKWTYFAEYKDIEEEGTWELEIYDMAQNKIFSREYHVTPLAKDESDSLQKEEG